MSNIHRADPSREAGVVSIFIVIFFMIFMSVIVVGFVKMVNDDQSQATDNDLSTSALASAQSGAEDGKRVLLFCKTATTPADKAACAVSLSSAACNAVTSNTTLTSALNIGVDTTGGRSDGIVSANSGYQQRYTCMTIKTATDSVEGISVENGTSEIIPLAATGNFDSLQFSWHATADGRNKPLNAFRTTVQLPAEDQWKSGTDAYAAAMRLEFIAYPKAGLNLSSLDADTRSVLLLPGSNGGASVGSIDLNSFDNRNVNPNALIAEHIPVLAKCQPTTEYACTMKISLTGPRDPANYNYFLRVSAVYGSAFIKAELRKVATTVQFNNVQPLIDVTGRANDVFRRIQTRVQYDAPMYLPQYAIETGDLCKNMIVTDRGATSSDLCNSGVPAPPAGGGSLDGNAAVADPGGGSSGAGVGGSTVVCWQQPGHTWTTQSCWNLTVINASNNAVGTLTSCTWDWGDRSSNTYPGTDPLCQNGANVRHRYTPTSPEGFYNRYNVVLTNRLVNGLIRSDNSHFFVLPDRP